MALLTYRYAMMPDAEKRPRIVAWSSSQFSNELSADPGRPNLTLQLQSTSKEQSAYLQLLLSWLNLPLPSLYSSGHGSSAG